MDEMEIRTWAFDQARMAAASSHNITIEEAAIRIARFVQTGSFDEKPEDKAPAPKTW